MNAEDQSLNESFSFTMVYIKSVYVIPLTLIIIYIFFCEKIYTKATKFLYTYRI